MSTKGKRIHELDDIHFVSDDTVFPAVHIHNGVISDVTHKVSIYHSINR